MYTPEYANCVPYRDRDPVAISVVVCLAFVFNTLLFFSYGAFQCPSVLCGSSTCFAGIEMYVPVSESLI